MLKQHNVENAEIPRPYDEAAPETLVQQHKAVVEAETAARLARAANNMKKDRDKVRKIIFKRETKKRTRNKKSWYVDNALCKPYNNMRFQMGNLRINHGFNIDQNAIQHNWTIKFLLVCH